MKWLGRQRGEREIEKTEMTKERNKDQKESFEEDFNRWIVQMEGEVECTRRSEQLTQEDFAIRINAQS